MTLSLQASRLWPWLCGLGLLLLSPASFAFADFGHRLICATAYELVQDDTRDFIDKVMAKATVSKAKSFAEGCTWPDVVRKTTHRDTYRYHFMNVPKGQGFDHDRDCAAYDCVTQAIQRYAIELSDNKTRWRDRKEALFFLGHFVADIHQPLHVGYAEDLGGNRIKVYRFNGAKKAKMNLHWLWDSYVPYKAGLGQSDAKQTLLAAIDNASYQDWQNNAVIAWAKESHCIAQQFVYRLPDGRSVKKNTRLAADYYEQAEPIVREQFMHAAVRLAWLLDQAAQGRMVFDTTVDVSASC